MSTDTPDMAAGISMPDPAPAAPAPLPVGTLEGILAVDDLGKQDVPIPEWGCTVTVRGLGHSEWARIKNVATDAGGEVQEEPLTQQLISTALVSPAVTPEQATLLMAKSVPAVNRIAKAVMELSKLTEGAAEQEVATFQG